MRYSKNSQGETEHRTLYFRHMGENNYISISQNDFGSRKDKIQAAFDWLSGYPITTHNSNI
jgi:hypothetical protein